MTGTRLRNSLWISCACCSPNLRPGTEPVAPGWQGPRARGGWAVTLQGTGRRNLPVTWVEVGLGWDETGQPQTGGHSQASRTTNLVRRAGRSQVVTFTLVCVSYVHTRTHMLMHAHTRTHTPMLPLVVRSRTSMPASLTQSRMKMSLTCQNGPGVGAGVTGGRRERAAGSGVQRDEEAGGSGRCAGLRACWRPRPPTLPAPAWTRWRGGHRSGPPEELRLTSAQVQLPSCCFCVGLSTLLEGTVVTTNVTVSLWL